MQHTTNKIIYAETALTFNAINNLISKRCYLRYFNFTDLLRLLNNKSRHLKK